MAFLTEKCFRTDLTQHLIDKCTKFSCGDKDLDDFFTNDALNYAKQLMGKTYVFIEKENPFKVVCCFTVANASVFTNYLPNARKKKVGKEIHPLKRDLIYPAVLIGRLGVSKDYHNLHIGSELLHFLKIWFIMPDNKTGCRFLVVDAYNSEVPLSFYLKNGFEFMFSTEEQEKIYRKIDSTDKLHTRLLYFDLMKIM